MKLNEFWSSGRRRGRLDPPFNKQMGTQNTLKQWYEKTASQTDRWTDGQTRHMTFHPPSAFQVNDRAAIFVCPLSHYVTNDNIHCTFSGPFQFKDPLFSLFNPDMPNTKSSVWGRYCVKRPLCSCARTLIGSTRGWLGETATAHAYSKRDVTQNCNVTPGDMKENNLLISNCIQMKLTFICKKWPSNRSMSPLRVDAPIWETLDLPPANVFNTFRDWWSRMT